MSRIKNVFLLSLLIFNLACTKKQIDDGSKTLNLAVVAQIKSMDPAFANDRYGGTEVGRVYEGLLQYHYLKNPAELMPNLAQGMPEVSPDGLTYTFKILPGVKFQDDPAFPNGKGRELVAEDFVYSIKRLADPHLQSNGFWIIDGKLKGLNEWRDQNASRTVTNYNETIEGVKALDNQTLQFILKKPYPQFLNALAMPFLFVVAHEVVNHYKDSFLNHPVGTGPYMIKEFSTNMNQLVYVKNPNFRDQFYPSDASGDLNTPANLEDAGKKLPLVDKIVVNIIVESQPRWLKFQKGDIEYLEIPKDNFSATVTKDKRLTPEMEKKGIRLLIAPSPDVTMYSFNMEHPLFKDNLNLRKAMSLAIDGNKLNELFYSGVSIVAQGIIPPGMGGYKADFVNPNRTFDIELAKKYLKEAGYPDGKGLPEIVLDVTNTTTSRQLGEFFQNSFKLIGIKLKLELNPWPELQKKIKTKQSMFFGNAWGGDYPDAENFLQLFYGQNASPGSNGANYNNPEFNALFEKASIMQDSPERTAYYEQLNKMIVDAVPVIFGVHRTSFSIYQGWLKNYVNSDFGHHTCKYLNIDLDKKKALRK
jgi:oligopeptide transport system substrate-binding protein